MTLGENKKIALGLIEEYSPNNIYLTEDEDIRNRLNLVYSANYQFLSQEKPILKTKKIKILEDSNSTIELNIPTDCRQIKRLVALDFDNNRISPNYEIIGKKVYLKEKAGKYILEYYAYPTEITENTKDEFELEIDRDAQALLPYVIANDVLKVDPSSDYSSFYNEYQNRLQRLDVRTILPSAEVTEGYDI